MNKLTDYLSTNHLSVRGYLWRVFLVILGLGIIATIIGVYRLTSQKTITRGLQSEAVSQAIDHVGGFLQEGEQITLASGSLTSTPSQIDIITEGDIYIGIDTDQDCNDFFNTRRQGALGTTDALCRTSQSRQQVITWNQVHKARMGTEWTNQERTDTYPTITTLITSDPLIIDQTTTQSLSSELQVATDDPQVINSIKSIAKIMRWPLIIGLTITTVLFSVFFVLFAILLPVIIFTLIARAISSITGHKSSFEKEFSRSRLPATLILIATRVIPGIGFWTGLIVWLIFPIHHAINQKKQPTH